MRRLRGGHLGSLGSIILCLLLASVTAPATAEAQAPSPVPAPGPAAPPSAGQEPSAGQDPEENYVVREGDTLWGIARGLFNDPLLWPRIWKRNPFITNPDRIFPGDTLAMPGREIAPAPVAEAPMPEPPKEVPTEEAKAPAPAPPAPEVEHAPMPPVPPASRQTIACSPVLVEEAAATTAGIGTVVKSHDNRLLLSQEDHVVVGVIGEQAPKVGDRLAIVRPGLRVIHPWHKQTLGRALFTLGILEIVEVQTPTAARARVIYSCDAITLGDRVVAFDLAPFPEEKTAQPATREIEGAIVDTPRALQLLGLQNLVYLDVGTGRGIGPGDVFAIYRPNVPAVNPGGDGVVPIPADRLGEAVVIRVTDTTATAVISASAKEIRAGDRVVLARQIQP